MLRTMSTQEQTTTRARQPEIADDPYNAATTQIDVYNPSLWVFHVAPDSGRIPDFEPGQFTTLGLIDEQAEPRIGKDGKPRHKMIKRAYSIASASDVKDHMEFLIVLVEEGKLTPKLFKLGVGDRMWMSDKISGDFTLEGVPQGSDVVFVGTGTGVAPYISMIRRYHGRGRWNRCVVVNGVRYEPDIAYRDELETLAKEDPNFSFIPCVTRDENWTGTKGRVPVALEPKFFRDWTGFDLDPETCHAFLCGSPQMIDDVEALLQERGFKTHKKKDPGNIHLERYW
jgi:ferredoxin--NADP+ reductase